MQASRLVGGARVIDGMTVAAQLRAELAPRVAAHLTNGGPVPRLAVVLASDSAADRRFAEHKRRDGAEVGIETELVFLPASASRTELLDEIARLNADPAVHGILVQTPFPEQIDELEAVRAVAPEKDIDGITPAQLGLLLQGTPQFRPATPAAILELLRRAEVPTAGAHAVIAGRSPLLALPLALMLADKAGANATVTIAGEDRADLASIMREADIVIAAMNRPHAIGAEHIRPGATVVDAGLNVIPGATPGARSRVLGDVDTAGVREVAGVVVPSPGGAGPVTIAVLLAQTLAAAGG